MIGTMRNKVSFYELESDGPEAHSQSYEKVHECFCNDYEPTISDHEILKIETNESSVALKIRRDLKGFQPTHNHYFELHHGFFKEVKFNIVFVAPDRKNPEFLKIVGQTESEE